MKRHNRTNQVTEVELATCSTKFLFQISQSTLLLSIDVVHQPNDVLEFVCFVSLINVTAPWWWWCTDQRLSFHFSGAIFKAALSDCLLIGRVTLHSTLFYLQQLLRLFVYLFIYFIFCTTARHLSVIHK